jgi:hypothetical protein
MSNTDPTNKQGWIQVITKVKQFLCLIYIVQQCLLCRLVPLLIIWNMFYQYPMLPMSLDCPFFITNVSGLSILHYQFIYSSESIHYNCCIRLCFIYNLWVTMCNVNDFLNDNFVLIVIFVAVSALSSGTSPNYMEYVLSVEDREWW